MYITVRYGENEEGIFNPNCKCVCLLNTIKDRCKLVDFTTDIDLSDESGNLKHLTNSPNRYATDILEEREILVLIRVNKKGSYTRYVPLLNDNETLTDTFYTQLRSAQEAGKSSGRRNKSSKSRDSSLRDVKVGSSKSSKTKGTLSRSSSKMNLKQN